MGSNLRDDKGLLYRIYLNRQVRRSLVLNNYFHCCFLCFLFLLPFYVIVKSYHRQQKHDALTFIQHIPQLYLHCR